MTIPHKEAIVALLDEVDAVPLAHRLGQHGGQRRRPPRRLQHRQERLRGRPARPAARREPRGSPASWPERAERRGRWSPRWWKTGPERSGSTTGRRERAVALCAQAASWGRRPLRSPWPRTKCRAPRREARPDRQRHLGGADASVKESAIPVDILHSRQIVMDLVYGAGSHGAGERGESSRCHRDRRQGDARDAGGGLV